MSAELAAEVESLSGIAAAALAARKAAEARADAAEAEVRALLARLTEAVPASYVAMKERALRAEDAVQRVRETCEQQVKDRSPYSDDRHRHGLDYVDGWNSALDHVKQALDGGAE